MCLGVALLLADMCVDVTRAQSDCSVPTFHHAHAMVGQTSKFVHGIVVPVTCVTAYMLKAPQTGITYNKTCNNGVWEPHYECVAVVCTGLPGVDDAQVIAMARPLTGGQTYNYLAEARVICNTGRTTENGRNWYRSVCTIASTWSDVHPCSSVIDTIVTGYKQYTTTGVLVGFTYKEEYGNKESTEYKVTVDAFNRALLVPMTAQFHSLYVGTRDVTFTELDTDRTQVDFVLLFQPTQQAKAEMVLSDVGAALAAQNLIITDPDTSRTFSFEGGQFQVSTTDDTGLFITRNATIALAVGGGLVALLAIILMVTCIVWRDQPCFTARMSGRTKKPFHPEAGWFPRQDRFGLPRAHYYS